MLIGAVLAVVGAIGVVLGATVVPWFVPSFDGGGLFGSALAVGPTVLGAAGLSGLLSLLALTLRRRKLAAGGLVLGLIAIGSVAVAFVALTRVLPESLDPALATFFARHRPPVGPGLWLSLAGGVAIVIGTLAQLTSVTSGRKGRFLRVSLLWNGTIVRQHLLTEPRNLEVGPDAHDGLVVPTSSLPARARLFEAHALTGAYDLVLRPGLLGTLSLGGDRQTPDSVRGEQAERRVRLMSDDWGKLDFGDVSVVFQFVEPGVTGGGRLGLDSWTPAATLAALFTMLGFVAYLCWKWDPEVERYAAAHQDKRGILVDAEAMAALREEPEEEKEPEEEAFDEDDPSKAAPDEEGKFGDPDLEKLESQVPKNEGKMVEKVESKKVGLVDLLQSQKFQNMTAMANILAANTAVMSSKLAVAMAGEGDVFVLGSGTNGMAFTGNRTGGGGEGPFGRIHGLGKIDGGAGGLDRSLSLPKKSPKRIGRFTTSTGQAAGFCSKDNIGSVVRARANAIRNCYEGRLQVNENLAGKLTARWTIGVEGRVTAASLTQNTVSDGQVGQCVLGVVRRMAFTRPEGGVCIVQWPFVFNPG